MKHGVNANTGPIKDIHDEIKKENFQSIEMKKEGICYDMEIQIHHM